MNIRSILKPGIGMAAIGALSLTAAGGPGLGSPRVEAAADGLRPVTMPLGLPLQGEAKAVLNASLVQHHPLYLDVPVGSTTVRSFVIYPDLTGKLPVVVVTAEGEGMSDWARAVATEVMNEGFIAVVPDVLSGMGPNGGGTYSFASSAAVAHAVRQMGPAEVERRTGAVRDYFASQPGSNGQSAVLDFKWSEARIDATIRTPAGQRTARFDLGEHAWHNTLASLTSLAASAQVVGAPPDQAAAQRDGLRALAQRKDIPPGYQAAMRLVDGSPRKGAWIDIPVTTAKGPLKLHSWLVQPLGMDKAPVVVIIMPGPGMDLGDMPQKDKGANWLRAVADSLASSGYIAILPDLSSGLGPNGGNFDSFQYPDDVGQAMQNRPMAERMALVKDARDYAVKLPRSNGKSATLGFCIGGSMAWQSAGMFPEIDAAVSFYGGPPDAATMATIHAPVIAFAGDQDPGLAPRVAASAADMQKLGKTFEFRVYPGTTHAFLYRQDLSLNSQATLDSWPRSMAFLAKYLKGQ